MKKIKIAFYLNILIFVLVLIATIFMLVGFKFMGEDLALAATKIETFKFFTVDSNVLMGLTALLFAYYEQQIIKKKMSKIPSELYILKLIFTTGVTLTFLVTVLYLAPIVQTGFFSMFKNSNLFFHLIIPILSLIVFIYFEKTDKIKFKYTFLGIIPTFIYAIFYLLNALMHIENGEVPYIYDWYGFAQGGIKLMPIVFIVMHLITYLICLVIWFLNKRKFRKSR